MVELVIVADDLTGALDAAAPFAGRGLVTRVALDATAFGVAMASGAQVVAMTTGSREIGADDARRATEAVACQIPDGVQVFKKVDSRLKGNIKAELSALPFTRALVAPAIPDFDRIVQDGCVTGFGVERPIPVAVVLGRYAAQADIPDVRTAEDMDEALAATSADLLVGARGLAEALARRMTGAAARGVDTLATPALFVIGSRDPITLRQVEGLRDAGAVWHPAPNGQATGAALSPLCVIQATVGEAEASPQDVSAALAASVHPHLTGQFRTLVVTGGATAEAVLRHMGITQLDLAGEALPGIVVARAGDLTIVTKSGGFGDGDALVRLARMTGVI